MEIKVNNYYWMTNSMNEQVQVLVCDIRQHGNVEIMDWSGSIGRVLVNHSELRQCKCKEFSGRAHGHGSNKVRMYKVARPNF